MIKDAPPILRDVDIGKPVPIVVANGYTLPISARGDARLLGYIGESSVAIVSVKNVAKWGVGIVEVTLPLFTK